MALKKDIDFKGIPVKEAYIRVTGVSIKEGNESIKFGISLMSSSESDSFDTDTGECPYDIDGENPINQAYAHLKTLEKYAGATDC